MKTNLILSASMAVALAFSYFPASAQLKIGTEPTVIDPNANLDVQSSGSGRTIIRKSTGDVEVKGSSFSVQPASGTSKFLVSPTGSLEIKEAGLSVTPSTVSSFTVNQAVGTEVKGQSFSVIPSTTQGQSRFSVSTNSKVTIADGTEGANKVLTSDANGIASWQALPSIQKFVTLDVFTQTSPVLYQFPPTTTQDRPAFPLNLQGVFTPKKSTDDFVIDGIVHYNVNNIGGERIGLAISVYVNGQRVGEEFIRNTYVPGGCYGDFVNVKYVVDPLLYKVGEQNTISLYVKPKRNDNANQPITYVGFGQGSSPDCGANANMKNNRIIVTSYQ